MNNFKCPYCKLEIKEPDDCHEQDVPYEHECPKCGKNFIFYVSYIVCYDSKQAPCLNGAEHNFKPIHGAPKEFFEGRQRCEWCGEEVVDQEKNNAAIKEYFDKLEANNE